MKSSPLYPFDYVGTSRWILTEFPRATARRGIVAEAHEKVNP